jgi:hypothetical protein
MAHLFEDLIMARCFPGWRLIRRPSHHGALPGRQPTPNAQDVITHSWMTSPMHFALRETTHVGRAVACWGMKRGRLGKVIPGRCKASNYDVQLHIGESRDSGFAHFIRAPE